MKFKIKTNEFKKGLDIVNHVTTSISTTPILENILIKAGYNHIILTSNNLDTAIEYVIKENLEIEKEWVFCLPSKLLISYINLLNDDEIELELKKDSVEIISNSSKIKIKWNTIDDFPLIPKIKEDISFDIPSSIFKKAIEKTVFSAAEWNIRPTLAWIYIKLNKDELVFASTDSFRLSEYKNTISNEKNIDFSAILPSKTAYEIKSILKDNEKIKVVSWDSQIAFYFWNVKFFSRLLNGKFPDYYSFFPTKYSTKAIVNKNDLIQALKKINLISRLNNYSIKMSFSSEIGIVLETSETQIWESEINLTWAIDGENNIIWINSTYFLEVLWVIDTTHINISFESPLSPILIIPIKDNEEKDDKISFKHIIMPLKI